MFKAILLTQTEDKKTRADLVDLDDSRLPERRRDGGRILVHAELQGRAGHHGPWRRGAPVAAGARHRPGRHGARQRAIPTGSRATPWW
jgi:hypothetical protein